RAGSVLPIHSLIPSAQSGPPATPLGCLQIQPNNVPAGSLRRAKLVRATLNLARCVHERDSTGINVHAR
ncbi:hypothetical protein PSTT_09851, partial [Puccinia striiformis]